MQTARRVPVQNQDLSVAGQLLPRRGPARLLGMTAAFWLASAMFHTVIFGFSGTAWAGSVSWRKPIVFSLSIGLLLWAFAWLLDRLPDRRRSAWSLAALFSFSSSVEVGLVAMQQWRGRASHFNSFEGGDAAVFAAMGVMVGVMSLMLVALFVWTLIERPVDPLIRLAAIGGRRVEHRRDRPGPVHRREHGQNSREARALETRFSRPGPGGGGGL